MHPFKFLAAWVKDWTALMSGGASVVLLFWWTFFPPHGNQIRPALLVVSAVCFAFGSYRVWAKEHQRVLDLTGKTQIESIDDLISEFDDLENWYGSDATTRARPLQQLIEKALCELRHHAPSSVHRFKDSATNPNALGERMFPLKGRTAGQLAKWHSNKKRRQCWLTVSACLYRLKQIRKDCISKLT